MASAVLWMGGWGGSEATPQVRGRSFHAGRIDDALLAGLPELRIIHGKGTGALRAGLTAYLSAHRAVKRLELASLHEGGAGATVIYL